MIQQPYETYIFYAILYFTLSVWFYLFDFLLVLHKKANPVSNPLKWVMDRLLKARHKKGYTYKVSDDISMFGWIMLLSPISIPVIIAKRIGNLFRRRAPLVKMAGGKWVRAAVEPTLLKCNICLNTNEYTGNDLVKDMEHEVVRCSFCNSTDLCFISQEKKYK